ncbi:unnamed protein product [Litomosoides sigmodontis]|uniref:Uncharacterized protein n=1 Tax=Litomosoides sigmodontis TaxID=42156 RepID=A0A3P6SY76_LITSI|nr:unnamed protein product [Litomosoides sigmodontis]
MANKPQITFARIVSGTTDMDDTGAGSVMATQFPVTVAVASTTIAATITATTATVTTTTTTTTTATATAAGITDTVTTEIASNEVTDVSTTTMGSVNQMSSTAPGDVCGVTTSSVPNSLGKSKDGLHQRCIEERKPDSSSNAHIQRSIQFGQQQQNQCHQQIQRRSKPRHKTDRLRKDDSVLSAGKEESEIHAEQPEIVLGPAPLPTVNAWFKQSTAEIKESKEDGIVNPQISSTKEANSQEISLSSKAVADDKDSVIKLVAQETLTFTSENSSNKTVKPSHSGQTKQEEQLDAEAANVDDKAWPSLNEAVNEELKQESVINNAKGSGHEPVKVTDSSEAAACYADVRQDRDRENENNGSGGKSSRSGKAWKKLDIDVDYAGREVQGRRGNSVSSGKSDHPQKTSRRGPNFAKQQTVKEESNPHCGIITDHPAEKKIVPALAPASLSGCAQPLSCIAPALMYSPECATVCEEYAEEDYW